MKILLSFCLLLLASNADAYRSKLDSFNALYDTWGTRLDTCTLCHNWSPNLNPYGTDFRDASGSDATALRAIERFDSDSDLASNIREIRALNFPGDPGDTTPAESKTWGAIKAVLR